MSLKLSADQPGSSLFKGSGKRKLVMEKEMEEVRLKFLVIDDPSGPPVDRDKVKAWYDLILGSGEGADRIAIIPSRIHDDDITALLGDVDAH